MLKIFWIIVLEYNPVEYSIGIFHPVDHSIEISSNTYWIFFGPCVGTYFLGGTMLNTIVQWSWVIFSIGEYNPFPILETPRNPGLHVYYWIYIPFGGPMGDIRDHPRIWLQLLWSRSSRSTQGLIASIGCQIFKHMLLTRKCYKANRRCAIVIPKHPLACHFWCLLSWSLKSNEFSV